MSPDHRDIITITVPWHPHGIFDDPVWWEYLQLYLSGLEDTVTENEPGKYRHTLRPKGSTDATDPCGAATPAEHQ